MRKTAGNKSHLNKLALESSEYSRNEAALSRENVLSLFNLLPEDRDKFLIISKKHTSEKELDDLRKGNPSKTPPIPGVSDEELLPLIEAKDLNIVHYIEQEGEQLPNRILNTLRGAVLWKNMIVIVPGSPYTPVVVSDNLKLSGGFLKLSGGHMPKPVFLTEESLRIRTYVEGTIINVFKANGIVFRVTHKNVIPQGVKTNDPNYPWINRPAQWGFGNSFIEDFNTIAKESCSFLLDDDFLFPSETLFSPIVYRFLLTTPRRLRADLSPCPKGGMITILDPVIAWELEGHPYFTDDEEDIADKIYIGKLHKVASIPADVMRRQPTFAESKVLSSCVVMQEPYDLEKANKILFCPEHLYDFWKHEKKLPEDERRESRFRDGGSVIITGKDSDGNEHVIQVSSTGYEWRQNYYDNSENLYNQFVIRMGDTKLRLDNQAELSLFEKNVELLEVPSLNSGEIELSIKMGLLQSLSWLDDEEFDNLLANIEDIRKLIWYNFLIHTNPVNWERISRFLNRYLEDIKFVKNQLYFHRKDATYFDSVKNLTVKSSLSKLQQILKNTKTDKDSKIKIFKYVDNLGGYTLKKLIKYVRDLSGTYHKSVLLSDPDAKFYKSIDNEKEDKTFIKRQHPEKVKRGTESFRKAKVTKPTGVSPYRKKVPQGEKNFPELK